MITALLAIIALAAVVVAAQTPAGSQVLRTLQERYRAEPIMWRCAIAAGLCSLVVIIWSATAFYDLRGRQNHVIEWVQGFHTRMSSPVPAADDIRFVYGLLHARGYTDKEIYLCGTIVAVDRCLYEGHHPPAAMAAGIKDFEGPYFPFPR